MNKVAFITMDVESFYDTSCIKDKNIPGNDEYDCAEELDKFIDFLDERNIKATFFLVASFIPRVKPYLLKAIKNGHAIGLHCLEHRILKNQDLESFEKDIIEAKKIVKKELEVEPLGFRFPCFELDEEHLQIIKNNGFLLDSSFFNARDNSYIKVNDSLYFKDDFYEFTLSKVGNRNISGGSVLRLLPFWTMFPKIKKYVKSHDAYVMYLHPFEISSKDLPTFDELNFKEKLFIQKGRKTYLDKISKVIDLLKSEGYIFPSMTDYINTIE